MSGSDGELKKPTRTTRQRARRSSPATRDRATRRTARPRSPTKLTRGSPTKAPPVEKVAPERTEEKRKAPTAFSSSKRARARVRKRNIISLMLIGIGVASSAAVGSTDPGGINVRQTIEERNERVRNNIANNIDSPEGNIILPVQSSSNLRELNSGLVGLGDIDTEPNPPTPIEDTSTSTATSTDSMATSTDEVASDDSSEGTETSDSEEVVNKEEDSPES